jgi:hypothetical protein
MSPRIRIRIDVDGCDVGALSLPLPGEPQIGPVELWMTIDTMISRNPMAWCLLKGFASKLGTVLESGYADRRCIDINTGREYPHDQVFFYAGIPYLVKPSVVMEYGELGEAEIPTWVAYLDHLANIGWQDDMGDVGGFVTDRFDLGHERFDVLRAMFPDLRDIQTVDLYSVPDRYGRRCVRDLRWRTSNLRLVESEDLRDSTLRASTLNQRDEG